MNIGWPEGISLAIMLLNLCAAAALHGEAKNPAKHSFPVTFMSALISLGLLYWGGFFA